jgi:hypothetical protein
MDKKWIVVDNGTESYITHKVPCGDDSNDIFDTCEEAKAELMSIAEYRIKEYQEMIEFLKVAPESTFF